MLRHLSRGFALGDGTSRQYTRRPSWPKRLTRFATLVVCSLATLLPASAADWPAGALEKAREFSKTLDTAAVVIVQHGKVVGQWGEVDAPFNCHSVRKSLLSALYGAHVAKGTIKLDMTLEQLGIDDNEPSLTETERKATIGDLLKARSGVYHPALYETKGMVARRPKRGSHPPGTFWYYNNWDFNALGAIFEKLTHRNVFVEFEDRIAKPLGMKDFQRDRDTRKVTGDDSIHPAYPFRLSARDLAKFGQLMLQNGRWGDKQLIPETWVRESTRSYSSAGYGYMWWVTVGATIFDGVAVPEGTYSARGHHGQYLVIIPKWDLVICHRVDSSKAGNSVSKSKFGKLLGLILAARPQSKHAGVIRKESRSDSSHTASRDRAERRLFIVGGGMNGAKIEPAMLRSFLKLNPAKDPHVLVIPYAATEENRERSGQRAAKSFTRLGLSRVTVLDLTDPEQALAEINACDAVWIPGGSQSRLMRALHGEQGTWSRAVADRCAAGIPIGGSSAGAAVMSEVMIAKANRDEATGDLQPVLSTGLGLAPEVIVDQHFSQRNRLQRLKIAVQKNPARIGLGIDERTAVVFDGPGRRFRVIGEGNVTVLRITAGQEEPAATILKAGDIYDLANPMARERLSEDLRELEGAYRLTEVVSVKVLAEGDDWFMQLGDGAKEKINTIHARLWEVPGLDIVFQGKQTRGRPELRVKRYGEIVSLKPACDFSAEFKAASIPEVVGRLTPRLMVAWNVPGVSVAVVRKNQPLWLGQYGVKQSGQGERVGPETVFEAASMSKPVFAYVALQLVDKGMLNLDTPLSEYWGQPPYTQAPLHKQITARMVMSHTSGFPNWRLGGWRSGGPIPVHFKPGSRFRYSGEGIFYLQNAIEKLTGRQGKADELIQERLLKPLGMRDSSYLWRPDYDTSAASGHDRRGNLKQAERSVYRSVNAAYTLYTTGADYAKFLIEMMNEDRSAAHSLSAQQLRDMLAIQSDCPDSKPQPRRNGDSTGTVHFGLGWKIDALDTGNRYVHTGSNSTGFRCHSEFNPKTGNGIVIMTNGVGGRALCKGLIRYAGEE